MTADPYRWPPSYYERPQPGPVHAECQHPRAYGYPCRLCAEPEPSLQELARWRADDAEWRYRQQQRRKAT